MATKEQAKPRSPVGLVIRVVLLVLLAVAIIGLVFDQRARSEARAAYERVQEAMGPEKKLREVTRDEVHKLIGREPDPDLSREGEEIYCWQGAILKQKVYVRYRPGKPPILRDVSHGEPFH